MKKYTRITLGLKLLLITIVLMGCETHLKKEVIERYDNGTNKKETFYTLLGTKKEVIKEIQYYENGQKKYVGYYKNGNKDGKWTFWYLNGKKQSEGYFLGGISTGITKVYHENGKLNYKGEFVEGQKNGKWEFYNIEGKKINEILFNMGKILSQSKGN